MTVVEVMVGAVILAICTPPILGCIIWMRSCAAETTIDGTVAAELNEQIALTRSLGKSAALTPGTTSSSQSLGSGVTLTVNRTISAVTGKPRVYDVVATGTWTSKTRGGQSRSLTVETYVFAPDN